jgi:asparagine synthase (glutamine-hydrolysing)
MSSISGFFRLDPAPVAGAEFEAKANQHAESGCAIAADATLYYRDELQAVLGLTKDSIDDAGLILSAYLRWGEDCARHLEGDFAFLIWDPRDHKLFGARDRYGLRPFYYHHSPGKSFAFASAARDVLSNRDVPFALNDGRIADFLVPELEWIDLTTTFYEGVFRLPPAHSVSIDAGGTRIVEYYSPEPGPALCLSTDEEYVEAFLEVFSRAVTERLRTEGFDVGSMLSGGIDSGSIIGIAGNYVHPFSLARRRGIDCQESRRIYATLDHVGLVGTQIIADDESSLIDELGTGLAEPFDGEYLFLKAIYEAARREDIAIMLDGAAGDVVFNESGYIIRLLRRGRLAKAWCEVVGEHAFWGGPVAISSFLRYLAGAYTPGFIRKPLSKPRQRWREREYVDASLISPEFAKRVDIEDRFDRMRETFAGTRSKDPAIERVCKIRPNLTAGRERYARIAASACIETRDPFTDQRVVDLCSCLPDRQLARDGWRKFLLRNAMAGRLPDAVRWGRGKPHIGAIYNRTFLKQEKYVGRLTFDRLLTGLNGYTDAAALHGAWQEFDAGGPAESIHKAYILLLWLEQSVNRPIVNNR